MIYAILAGVIGLQFWVMVRYIRKASRLGRGLKSTQAALEIKERQLEQAINGPLRSDDLVDSLREDGL